MVSIDDFVVAVCDSFPNLNHQQVEYIVKYIIDDIRQSDGITDETLNTFLHRFGPFSIAFQRVSFVIIIIIIIIMLGILFWSFCFGC